MLKWFFSNFILWQNFQFLYTCYRMNCASLKFICWSPKPQSDSVWRWGLWEVMRSWGWGPRDAISALVGRGASANLLPLPLPLSWTVHKKEVMWGHSDMVAWSWTFSLQSSKKMNVCSLSPQSMVLCHGNLSCLVQYCIPLSPFWKSRNSRYLQSHRHLWQYEPHLRIMF